MNDRHNNNFSLGLLVGGKSKRFGSEKHKALVDGISMAEKVYRAAEGLVSKTIVSVGDAAKHLTIPGYETAEDTFPGSGPLAGIHACMGAMSTEWLVVLACDLPYITRESLDKLVASATPPTQAVIARAAEGDTQPLCACYHRSVFEALSTALEAGRNSVYRFVDSIDEVKEIEVPARELTNVNHPTDLFGRDS